MNGLLNEPVALIIVMALNISPVYIRIANPSTFFFNQIYSLYGELELRNPETGFYIGGMKSYGLAPTFLMTTGYWL